MIFSTLPWLDQAVRSGRVVDPRWSAVWAFHEEHRAAMYSVPARLTPADTRPGGYADHLWQCFVLSQRLHAGLPSEITKHIAQGSAWLVLYFYKIDRLWRGVDAASSDLDHWYDALLPARYGLVFTPVERAVLRVLTKGSAQETPDLPASDLIAFCQACIVLADVGAARDAVGVARRTSVYRPVHTKWSQLPDVWSADEVWRQQQSQQRGDTVYFCPDRLSSRHSHGGGAVALVATSKGFICQYCDYIQGDVMPLPNNF